MRNIYKYSHHIKERSFSLSNQNIINEIFNNKKEIKDNYKKFIGEIQKIISVEKYPLTDNSIENLSEKKNQIDILLNSCKSLIYKNISKIKSNRKIKENIHIESNSLAYYYLNISDHYLKSKTKNKTLQFEYFKKKNELAEKQEKLNKIKMKFLIKIPIMEILISDPEKNKLTMNHEKETNKILNNELKMINIGQRNTLNYITNSIEHFIHKQNKNKLKENTNNVQNSSYNKIKCLSFTY